MKNPDVLAMLDECSADLGTVGTLHASMGATSTVALYLTRYALIRACGTIELAYKAIIADYCSKRSKIQVKTYLAAKVRGQARNPTYQNLCGLLGEFDENWSKTFKTKIQSRPDKDQVMGALQSLVSARNDFAHGGSPTITLGDVLAYYGLARQAVEEIDTIVS